jgi:hypothetical protein
MTSFRDRTPWTVSFLLILLLSTGAMASAQQSSSSDQTPIQAQGPQLYSANGEPGPLSYGENDLDLPDDPGALPGAQQSPPAPVGSPAQAANGQVGSTEGKQTKRILYIVPNFRAVSTNSHLPPQSTIEKFKTAAADSFDYSSFIFVGLQAGLGQIGNSYPEFGNGTVGYGRYYWHTFADSTDENLWVEFVIPSVLHQDTRYYTLGHGGFGKRLVYAVTRIAITRNDGGKETVNVSEIAGAGVAAGISNLYYPAQERTWIKSYQRWITNVSIDGGVFIVKEFWPDVNNKIFHQKD